MRLSLAIKTLFRSPLRTLLTFVLLAAAAFMLVYSAADYALTQREYSKAVSTYRGFVSVEKGAAKDTALPWRPYFLLSDPSNPANYDNFYNYDTYHQNSISSFELDTIMKLPYITSVDRRYMTAGLTDGYYRTYKIGEDLYKNYFNTTARFVIEATFNKTDNTTVDITAFGDSYSDKGLNMYNIYISNVKLLAGDKEWLTLPDSLVKEGEYRIRVLTPLSNYYEKTSFSFHIGVSRTASFYRNNHVTEEQLNNLISGKRYIFVGRVEPLTYKVSKDSTISSFCIGDDTLYDWIFQAFQLFPLLTVIENVCYPMELCGVMPKDAKERARLLLERVCITEEKHNRFPSNLSGGEQQRVAIARSLSTGAKTLLADEPTGNLDAVNTKNIMEILRGLAHNDGCCVIVVTHDPEVSESTDIVYRMKDGVLTLER